MDLVHVHVLRGDILYHPSRHRVQHTGGEGAEGAPGGQGRSPGQRGHRGRRGREAAPAPGADGGVASRLLPQPPDVGRGRGKSSSLRGDPRGDVIPIVRTWILHHLRCVTRSERDVSIKSSLDGAKLPMSFTDFTSATAFSSLDPSFFTAFLSPFTQNFTKFHAEKVPLVTKTKLPFCSKLQTPKKFHQRAVFAVKPFP